MAEAAHQEQQNFTIQRIFLKDLSFEAPNVLSNVPKRLES